MKKMTRGTRHLFGDEALDFQKVTESLIKTVTTWGYKPFYPSTLADQKLFVDKAGDEVLNQMYTFKDKGDRDLCLIPEVTAVVQNLYNEHWSKTLPKPIKLYYLTKCYRYERPQEGRYREFWQFGIELLGGEEDILVRDVLVNALYNVNPQAFENNIYKFNGKVKRGLNYYVEDGFEVEVPSLGAQKQIAGGGRYKEGIGWAIGVDRLLLALKNPLDKAE
jgi:histidyl-tRNA synthetase